MSSDLSSSESPTVFLQNLEGLLVIFMGFLHGIFLQVFMTYYLKLVLRFLGEIFFGEITMPEMKSQGFIESRQPIAHHMLDAQADPLMHGLAIFFEEAIIDHVLDQSVLNTYFCSD